MKGRRERACPEVHTHHSAREYRITVPACAAVHTLESPPSHPSCVGASLQPFRMDRAASDPHLTTGRKSSGRGGLTELSAQRPLSREIPGSWEARWLSCCLFSDQPLGCVSIHMYSPSCARDAAVTGQTRRCSRGTWSLAASGFFPLH